MDPSVQTHCPLHTHPSLSHPDSLWSLTDQSSGLQAAGQGGGGFEEWSVSVRGAEICLASSGTISPTKAPPPSPLLHCHNGWHLHQPNDIKRHYFPATEIKEIVCNYDVILRNQSPPPPTPPPFAASHIINSVLFSS